MEAQLRAAPPHALVATARRLLAERAGAQDVTLLLADYGLAVLQPVSHLPHTEEPVSAHDGPAGSAFTHQSPVVEVLRDPAGHLVHLPITVRGDRLGVLSVRLPAGTAAPETVLRLGDFATALGHEVTTAGRDTDLYLQARRTRRLTLAAEMQWQLLPGRGCAREEYAIGAHLEPAYSIGGDNFDWSTSADHLVLSVTDGMGEGIHASLLTSLTVGALRNARRAGIGLADQACLADQAVFAQYGGKVYASTLLLEFHLATGTVRAVDAGSPQLFRQRGDHTERVELDAQLPLGMFEETPYDEQTFQVEPGDRLIVVSTGVHGTRSAAGDLFGERALRQILGATRSTPTYETARAVVAGLIEHYGSRELMSDAAVICLDWQGRQG
ncbi:PP2C family protein-serine/threonine phosphatase [Streptomyces griseorubiginosus]|uniref:PP2C family protein-serine/threonine phosphatase n=1 Tax=Streptomyces griseorubiginosus TaxID=67304 RepID=UPI002E80DFDD|nr:PP2C family protein-serine/threonine phosphatase [Streptomyces griseorubiginosus]WUB48753.1 serine/threonine-protein phosphatase [Streptomyces griseorubiginosus]WUB57280.1 serine/threonine-protein phosphatase [Streptomyces griseorubiginosus]